MDVEALKKIGMDDNCQECYTTTQHFVFENQEPQHILDNHHQVEQLDYE